MNSIPTDEVRQAVLSGIHQEAILPAIGVFSTYCSNYTKLAETWKHSLRFHLWGKPGTLLKPGAMGLEVITCSEERGQIEISFLSHRQLNNLFLESGFFLPIVTRGFLHLSELSSFKKLSQEFRKIMEPEKLPPDDSILALHSRLLLTVAVHGLQALSEHDPDSLHQLRSLPSGWAQFRIASENFSVWAHHSDGLVHCQLQAPEFPSDVTLEFDSPLTTYQTLNDLNDVLADVGLGKISVRGLIPLADGLNLVMGRLRLFLPTKS